MSNIFNFIIIKNKKPYLCQMKLFCYIFSFYIICLLAYPCQDYKNISCSNYKEECSSSTEHKEDNDCHSCPPFCVCNCCQVNTIVVLKVLLNSVNIDLIAEVRTIYKEISVKEIILTIWQPPKI